MLSDLVLVPSSFTGRAVRVLAPETTRIVQVPYGFDLTPFSRPAGPEQGRILSVGSVGLLKGHPDLAAASRILRAASASYRVRVVGPRSQDILDEAMMDGPQYVGQVPRSEIVSEFAKADLLAFPTICDSFGIVVVEALAMGVPVVCTPNCGDIVRDGVEGFVVPPRDPAALAERIRTIVEDRDLRERMSRNARARAAEFSLEAYAIRLLSAMRSVVSLPHANF
jgi:glycosyltransferase involved in cell wall biosynthesis